MKKGDRVSVIIPTLNEEESLEYVFNKIPKDDIDEVILVDGGSTDRTMEIAQKLGLKAIRQEGSGLGSAVKQGLELTSGDIKIILDADGSHNPEDIIRLIEKVQEGYDVVVASRYCNTLSLSSIFKKGTSYDDTVLTTIGNKFFTLICKLVFKVPINDILMGFKAFRKEVFEKIKIDAKGPEYNVEVVLKAHKAGFKIGEISTIEQKRRGGKSKLNAFNDGMRILIEIIKNF